MVIFSCVVLFLSLAVWFELSSWNAQLSRTNSYMTQTARAIAQHTDDVIEVAKQPLAGVTFQISDKNKTVLHSLELIHVMRDMVKRSPYLRSLAYIGADGRLIESTVDSFAGGLDLSGQAYFTRHRNDISLEPLIDGPYKGLLSEQWFITLSQRLNNDQGQFAGVVVATVDIKHFVNFFNSFDTFDGGTFAMIDATGRLLIRTPMNESAMGKSLADTPLYRDALLVSNSGNFNYVSPFDNIRKASGYFKSSKTGITALVAIPKQAVLRHWIRLAQTRWLCSLIALAASVGLAIYLSRQSELRRRDERIIAAREAEFQVIANASSDLIEKLDDHGIRQYVSAASRSVLGIEPEKLVGQSILESYDADARQYWIEALANITAGSSVERLIVRRQKESGELAWLETVVTRVRSFSAGSGMVAVTRDVTSQKRVQEELDRLANTDELTQLSNKRHFTGQLKRLASEARMVGTPLSLLVLDVDRFKLFNDTYGHLPGDTCLQAISAEIQHTIRQGVDLAARYGGEEIAVLLPGMTETEAWAMADLIRHRIALLGIVHQKNQPWGHVTVSIGVASLCHDNDPSDDALFVKADQALYLAKNTGRNKVVGSADVSDQQTAAAA
ncbi:sensor domain-containing diguanylate cyclase [Allorhizobium taibaishanense]|uniref:diguanylate cyclase n=1 Tax=Allorhizobium taibaishanense TaxID=887144 RepID=A0A1Q9A4J2_9HYPH|nr:diguanylate cyclase [Allorhizobium taibaishanense]MBB4006455.1 diguanylate cyclase (GGDEF)-like protein/PAS domain S-box-containing protein [Allorhizobium taibaishanense]OLP49397.1 hypothetical protein BJF91_20345 [Allorhizobium taibaishanense]